MRLNRNKYQIPRKSDIDRRRRSETENIERVIESANKGQFYRLNKFYFLRITERKRQYLKKNQVIFSKKKLISLSLIRVCVCVLLCMCTCMFCSRLLRWIIMIIVSYLSATFLCRLKNVILLIFLLIFLSFKIFE